MRNKSQAVLIAFFLLLFFSKAFAEANIPPEGALFPKVSILLPEKPCDRDYLGLGEKKTFTLGQINADIVIVEIFSMYCPYCQKEASLVNELYEGIQKKADMKDRIKIIGLGAGNTLFEVNLFKNQYNIKFPLIPDESFAIHKAVGEVRTPYFFVVKINPDGSTKILYSKVGTIQEPAQFLNMILNRAEIKQEVK